MTTRLTTREIVRGEMQQLFHEGFNLLKALEAQQAKLLETDLPETTRTIVREMERTTNRLIAIEEMVRARMLSTIG